MVNSGGNDILAERETQFSRALRGYDRREVDAYVRRLRARAGHLASELEEKERRLSEVGGDVSVPLQVVGSGNLGARVERIIAQAELEAREIREQAEQDAAETRKAYEDQAEEARRRREELAKRADEQARAMIRAAEEEVARLRATRQAVLDQLRGIGDIIGTATDQAARTPELEVRIEDVLGIEAEGDEPAGTASEESDVDGTETAADTAQDEDPVVPEQKDDPDAPVVAEPRKPAEAGKISPAMLAAKARRQAKKEQVTAASEA